MYRKANVKAVFEYFGGKARSKETTRKNKEYVGG
jgi:hypothetical protein